MLQLTSEPEKLLDMDYYLEKSYCKTASLLANSAKAVASLAGHTAEVRISG